jgi:hypothetical protein
MGDYKTNKPIIDMSILLKRVVSKGYSEDALKKTIEHYERMNIIMKMGGNLLFV